jgi:hypothetical protein
VPSPRLEAFLARLYVDAALRASFLADAEATLAATDLDVSERAGVLAIDREGLRLAARSFASKRAQRHGASRAPR